MAKNKRVRRRAPAPPSAHGPKTDVAKKEGPCRLRGTDPCITLNLALRSGGGLDTKATRGLSLRRSEALVLHALLKGDLAKDEVDAILLGLPHSRREWYEQSWHQGLRVRLGEIVRALGEPNARGVWSFR